MKPLQINCFISKLLLAFTLLYPLEAFANTPTSVPHIRLDDYLGKWYEIGRLPMSFQEKCTHNVIATYTLQNDGNIDIFNECMTAQGPMSVHGEAYAIDSTNSKLKVSFLPGFLKKLPIGKANYWVLASDEDTQGRYSAALVGTPDHKYLWVLSRTPTLSDDTYNRYLGIATKNGYNLQAFKKTDQQASD